MQNLCLTPFQYSNINSLKDYNYIFYIVPKNNRYHKCINEKTYITLSVQNNKLITNYPKKEIKLLFEPLRQKIIDYTIKIKTHNFLSNPFYIDYRRIEVNLNLIQIYRILP